MRFTKTRSYAAQCGGEEGKPVGFMSGKFHVEIMLEDAVKNGYAKKGI